MIKRDDRYWADRNDEKLKAVSDIVDEDVKSIIEIINQGNKELNNQIRDMYLKYSKDNKMSYSETLKYLKNNERNEFQKDVQYYIEKYHDKEYVKAHKKELQSLSVRARVQRIEEMQVQITKFAESLHSHLNGTSKDRLSEAFNESYYHTAHATSGTGISSSFKLPNVNDVEEVLKNPWSGKDYSEKVWNITDNFASKLKSELNKGLIQGKHPDEIARSWRKLTAEKNGPGGTVYECRRLMESEAANVSEQASKKYYDEVGVEKYRYLTSGHANVCEDCAELQRRSNEEDFLVRDAVTGVNYAPMHPFCHCTSVPVTIYDDEDDTEFNMPYDEWKKAYIDSILNAQIYEENTNDLDIPSFANQKANDNRLKPIEPHDSGTVNEYYKLLDVKTENQRVIDCIKKDMAIIPLSDLDILKKHKLVIDETNENRSYHKRPAKILQPFIDNKIMINVNTKERGHFAHEFAHFVADKTNLYKNDDFKDVIGNALKGSNKKFKNGYLYVVSDKFVTEYQGRTYLKSSDFKNKGYVNYSDLREYISVGYQTYIACPQILYETDKMLYDWFEKEGLYHEAR